MHDLGRVEDTEPRTVFCHWMTMSRCGIAVERQCIPRLNGRTNLDTNKGELTKVIKLLMTSHSGD